MSRLQEKLTLFLKSCGYHPKKDIAYVPISGLYGDNIKNPVDHKKIWCGLVQRSADLTVHTSSSTCTRIP
jgi:translation elongation factor EF-1alpha